MQQGIILTPQILEQIRTETGQEWRKCQRKAYQISACKVPAGYIFANKLEQPHSYKALMQQFKTPFVKSSDIPPQSELANILRREGYYETDVSKFVLCGTKGELWDVRDDKLVSSYTLPDGQPVYYIQGGFGLGKWFAVARAQETQPSAMGIQIPKKYLAAFQTSWGSWLKMNDEYSDGHGTGDILVVPVVNGQFDYANASPTNNHVFALTYNLGVGGWANSGLIDSPKRIKQVTVSDCASMFKFTVETGITKVHATELHALTLKYGILDTYERVMRQNEDLMCMTVILILRILDRYIEEHGKKYNLCIFDNYFLDMEEKDKHFIDLRVNAEDYGDYHITGAINEEGTDYSLSYYGWAATAINNDSEEAWLYGNSIPEIYNNFVKCVKDTQKKYNSL